MQMITKKKRSRMMAKAMWLGGLAIVGWTGASIGQGNRAPGQSQQASGSKVVSELKAFKVTMKDGAE